MQWVDEELRVRPNEEAPRRLRGVLKLLPAPARLMSLGSNRIKVIVPAPFYAVQLTPQLRAVIRAATDAGYEIGPFIDNDRSSFVERDPVRAELFGRSAINPGPAGSPGVEFQSMLIAKTPNGLEWYDLWDDAAQEELADFGRSVTQRSEPSAEWVAAVQCGDLSLDMTVIFSSDRNTVPGPAIVDALCRVNPFASFDHSLPPLVLSDQLELLLQGQRSPRANPLPGFLDSVESGELVDLLLNERSHELVESSSLPEDSLSYEPMRYYVDGDSQVASPLPPTPGVGNFQLGANPKPDKPDANLSVQDRELIRLRDELEEAAVSATLPAAASQDSRPPSGDHAAALAVVTGTVVPEDAQIALPFSVPPSDCPMHLVDQTGEVRNAVAAVNLPPVATGVDRVQPFEVHLPEEEREAFNLRDGRAKRFVDAVTDADPVKRARKEQIMEVAQRLEDNTLLIRSFKPETVGEWIAAAMLRITAPKDVPELRRSGGPDKLFDHICAAGKATACHGDFARNVSLGVYVSPIKDNVTSFLKPRSSANPGSHGNASQAFLHWLPHYLNELEELLEFPAQPWCSCVAAYREHAMRAFATGREERNLPSGVSPDASLVHKQATLQALMSSLPRWAIQRAKDFEFKQEDLDFLHGLRVSLPLLALRYRH